MTRAPDQGSPSLAVHLIHAPAPAHLALLEGALCDRVSLTFGQEVFEGAEVLVGGVPLPEQLDGPAHLRAFVLPFAGIPPATRALLLERPHLEVYNLHHNAPAVAEMAVALMLAAARVIVPADRALRAHDWSIRYDDKDPGLSLSGRAALVLGYGEIGRRVARICLALGMTVRALRRGPLEQPINDDGVEVFGGARLLELLPKAEALIICLPQTEETEGLIGAEEIAALPPRAVLVNIGRAAIVDEQALFDALSAGRLHSAGLDVWTQYPADVEARTRTAPSRLPFESLDNVVMSPHRAGHGEDVERLRMVRLAALLDGLAGCAPLPERVDCARGY